MAQAMWKRKQGAGLDPAGQDQPEDAADKRYALLKQRPATMLRAVDEPTLLTAGR